MPLANFRNIIPKKSKEREVLVQKERELKQKLSNLKKNDRTEESKIKKEIAKQRLLIKQYDVNQKIKSYGSVKK